MGFVLGFLPWILYWVLIGNVPFRTAVVVVLAVAVATQVVGRLRHQPWRSLDVGSLIVFVLLAVAAFVLDDAVLQRWMQPLSNLGITLVALGGLLVGRPFVREYAAASVDAATARTDGFATITRWMTWLWVGVFAGMTVLSAVPPVVDGDATLRDEDDLLSILCYWVLPYVLLGIGGLVSGLFPPWFEKRSAMVSAREAAEAPAVAPQAASPPDTATGGLRLDVPAASRHDQPFPAVLHGAEAGSATELTATGCDLFGRPWRSSARFTAPASGRLDVGAIAPDSGDWAEADSTLPLSAMRFVGDTTPDLFVPPADRWAVTLTVTAGRGSVRRTVHRSAADPGVHTVPIESAGRPGRLVLPGGSPPPGGWPAVACFGGSEGGFDSQVGTAQLLASLGFAALAWSWVDQVDGSATVAEIPLERFTQALTFLAGRPEVAADRMAAMAVSRGAEGLLAAVCATPEAPCRGLVLVSPSSVTWQAVGDDGSIPDTSSWTLSGRPVPWRPMPTGVLMPQVIRNAWRIGRDTAAHRPSLLRLRPAYEEGLGAGGAGAISANRTDAPLLLLTGSDDAVWPSGAMADALLAGRPAGPGDRHVAYPGAGHLIRLGALPTDAQWTSGIALGGTREGQAAAQRDAVQRVPAFLREVTAPGAPGPPAHVETRTAGTGRGPGPA